MSAALYRRLQRDPGERTTLMDAAVVALRQSRKWPVLFVFRGDQCKAHKTNFRTLAEVKVGSRWMPGACRWD